ncbi:MlaA family lipoprotein [Caulobacter sp. LARHSG274]
MRRPRLAAIALGLITVGGAASIASIASAQVAEPVPTVAAPPSTATPTDQDGTVQDPLHGFNRASYGFSMGLDRVLIGPIAHGYMKVTPTPVRHRVSSVVYNLGEPSTALNDVLQGRPKRAGVTTSRFLINSTVGLLGLFDVAAKWGLPSHDGDFGQTFGRYGVKPGPYLYVPVIGPLNFRDGLGRALDFATDPVGIAGGGYTTTFGATRLAVGTVDTRANADGAFRALDDATDPYVTVRSAYGQHRAALVREATGKTQDLPDFDDPTSLDPAPTSATTTPSATQ